MSKKLVWYMCHDCGAMLPSVAYGFGEMTPKIMDLEGELLTDIHREKSKSCTPIELTGLWLDDDEDTALLNRMYDLQGNRTGYDYRPLIADIKEAEEGYVNMYDDLMYVAGFPRLAYMAQITLPPNSMRPNTLIIAKEMKK